MSKIYIEEFLWRGGDEPAWHIVLSSIEKDQFGRPVRHDMTCSVMMAKKLGYDLKDVIENINVNALKQNELQQSTIANLSAQTEKLIQLNEELSNANSVMTGRLDELRRGVSPSLWKRIFG